MLFSQAYFISGPTEHVITHNGEADYTTLGYRHLLGASVVSCQPLLYNNLSHGVVSAMKGLNSSQ